jgi:hypothetical protein
MRPRKPFSLSAAALAIVALAAPPTFAGVQTQRAESLGTFEMPAGDNFDPAALSVFDYQEIRTGIPMGEDLLLQEKELGASGLGDYAGDTPLDVTEELDASVAAESADAESADAAADVLYPATACNTNIATGFAPPDIHGAAGPKVLVVVTNVDIGVYNKSGCAINSRVALKTLFAGFGDIANQTLFDPKVLYDRNKGRFFVTVESRDNRAGNTDQYQYFAVSTTNGATAWHRYRFTLSSGTSFFCKRAADSFWDYPASGKSLNRWFITANDFPAAGGATGAILVIDKTPTLTGAGTSGRCWNNLQFNIAAPFVLDGNNQSVFLYPRSGLIGRYNHTTGATLGADTLASGANYPIAAWSAPPDAVQPNGQRLDSLDGRFQSHSIQSRDRIWNIHTIASGSTPVIRWYRLKRSASTTLSTVTFSSGHLFNPSFTTGSGIDGAPAFINASRTIPTCSTSSCLPAMMLYSGPNSKGTGWLGSVAATSTNQFLTTNGSTLCNNDARGSCRWGDYSSISVDPGSAGSAWGFNQLVNGTNMFNWFTRARKEVYNLQK